MTQIPTQVPTLGRRALSPLHRLRQVFRRYVARHLALSAPGFDLAAKTGGAVQGGLGQVALNEGRLTFAGKTTARLIRVRYHRDRYETVPKAADEAADGQGDFVFDLPFAPGPLRLEFEGPDGVQHITLDGFSRQQVRRATLGLWPPFLAVVLRAIPALWRWKRHGDFGARETVKQALGLAAHIPAQPMTPALFANSPTPKPARTGAGGVTIVLPVYNAFDLLEETLERVRRHTDVPWRLILIEDKSSDIRVRPFLRDWAEKNRAAQSRAEKTLQDSPVTLIENSENLGFIASVNKGFAKALAYDDPVILLNSDAFVPPGWASRLLWPLHENPDVASVTPMSNDGEIFSVPAICHATPLHPGEGDRLDLLAQRFDQPATLVPVPTGVGFCMAINLAFLRQLPVFDTGFGRGYGEETDWCQKTRALGGRHLGFAGLFVEHHGAGSFGTEEKQQRMAQSGAIIAQRYPDYDLEVQDFIRYDPLTTARLALAISWAAMRQNTRFPIYLAHAMGGGAEKYLERRIAGDIAAGGAALVLRVGQSLRWRLELHSAQGVTQGLCDDIALVHRLLEPVTARRIVYSCAVGDRDPGGLPQILQELADGNGDRIEVLMHDYLPLSPSYTLLESDGFYRGVPAADSNDPAHRISDKPGDSLESWRQNWGALMAAAEVITVFSQDSQALVSQAYPAATAAIQIRPHEQLTEVPKIAAPPQAKRPVIGVLGNVGYQKGAGVLAELSQILAKEGQAGLVVIGNLDPGYRLAAPAIVHGSYRHSDIAALAARYGITCWLIPSIWPETFSFATREALATGLPVWCFDLGAQAEAVKAALAAGGQGAVVPLAQGRADPAQLLEHILLHWKAAKS